MLAILERIKQIVAERLAKAKAIIESYTPVSGNVPEPAEDKVPDNVVIPDPVTPEPATPERPEPATPEIPERPEPPVPVPAPTPEPRNKS